MTDSDEIKCPVCRKHNKTDALGAQGMVVTAAKALIHGDDITINAAAENSDPYCFHMAVTMYVDTLEAYGEIIGMSLDELLDNMRGQLDAASANQ